MWYSESMTIRTTYPSAASLRLLFDYNSETGILTWKSRPSVNKRADKRRPTKARTAGCLSTDGYVRVGIKTEKSRLFSAHRIIWIMVFGEDPEHEIDHVNRIKHDNRLSNLRLATRSNNAQNTSVNKNNTSGVRGVSWHKGQQEWRVKIRLHGKRYDLSSFDSLDEAAAAYQKAALDMHGDFAGQFVRGG